MDNLAKCAVAATKLGISYGKYMAMKDPVAVTPPVRHGIWRTCPYCGKEFVCYTKVRAIYCGVICKKAANAARKYERLHGHPKEAKPKKGEKAGGTGEE